MYFKGRTNFVNTIVITSDNKYIISGSYDNTIRIWNLLNTRQKAVFDGHRDHVLQIAATFDNKYIIFSSLDRTIRIWNLLEKDNKVFYKNILIFGRS